MSPRGKGRLVVCSLGAGGAATVTLQALEALAACVRVVVERPSEDTESALRLCGRRGSAWTGPGPLLSELRRGRTVGLLVEGRSPELMRLAARCRSEGFEVEALPAVSSADLHLARTGSVLGHDFLGLRTGAAGVEEVG